jgi:alpha-L-rhamnosidase
MCRWIDYMHTYGDEEYGFMGAWHYGDWLAMDAGEGQYRGATQTDLIACAFFAYSTDIVVRALKVLGEDASEYEALYEKVRAHFRSRFMKDGLPVLYPKYDGLSTDRPVSAMTQTAIVLILKFGLYEECERALLAKTLVDMIRANGTRMTTGFVGTPYILHVLSDNGYADVAYDLLLQEQSPSWLFSVNHGATTMWEHWDSQKEDGTFWSTDMNSFNHYAYGSVYDWIFGVGTGITVRPDGAGYKKVKIAPTPDARLGYMDASIETEGGLLRSAWRYHDDHIRFEITVPDGTSALVTLPDGFERTLTGGEYVFVRTIADKTAQ